ncbi:hypothetical protein SAMN05216350_11376 [Polaromonas sp. YR568]|uniref:GT99 family glycosyltransferase N-terminal domain-containing protein n=1 Tax=Polaromonas sp. YR568 TaxID=1855301 RepID=UPI0008E8985F|nr:hypothetical protein [Polaromonas sp. YR568]SFV01843.1 hypothetical protein SAMN05216350_11376 [Polaromonas sp. YR568]
MFAVFLPALNFRGNRSPYLWWFYKFLSEFGESAAYVCGDEYFLDPKVHHQNGRDEASGEVANQLGYQLPDERLLHALRKADIQVEVWQALEQMFPGNPLESFRHFCLKNDELLHEALTRAFNQLKQSHGNIEVVITCVNCATLQRFCREQSLPLLHIELGPFRSPQYLATAYFDFSGVNGGTESQRRFNSSSNSMDPQNDPLTVDAVRSLFMVGKPPLQTQPSCELGIGLQIEDDSNIICYSNGFSSLSLLNNSRKLLAERKLKAPVLVRGHPGSFFSPKNLPPGLSIDPSETAMKFIQSCKEVHTINSSLAVEFLLQGKKATVFGESPFSFCIDADTREHLTSALCFFCLNYLVPWRLAISSDYIRWRLLNSEEQAIRDIHMEFYMREKITLLETQIADLERELSEKNKQIAVLQSSISWRLIYFFRKIFRFVSRRLGWANK